ncbi:cohesin domain-containing protein [uncultured Ruminococcus sp.]|uniref:cohesin domain-containing protein n=1 Tax=uncultured Ruminococcus sp. TaxID=165186 RepID=UPI0025DE4179|nr:cohesin domain-containing protein [uncultured Ruminococcus sp.]
MKKHLVKIISLCFASVLMLSFMTSITAFAADDELTVNSNAKVKVGDKIKYTLYLSDTKEDIIGFELRMFYDHNYLELDKDSVNYGKFDGVIHNLNIEDKIPINWTNISTPVSFSSKAEFLSMEFKVVKGGETEISQFVSEMYGDDMTYLKSYKWTYDITVNDKSIVKDQTPVISDDQQTLEKNQGSFINYIDGMGEENTPNKDNHQAVVGSVPGTQIATQYVDVTRYENVSSDGSFNMMPIIVIVAVVVVAGAIVAILIIKKRDDAKISAENDNNVEN